MDFIISFIKSMSVISVVLAAVWLLIPKGGMQASFKYVMGLFTIAAIISAFSTAGDFTLPNLKIDTEKLTAETYANIENETLRFAIEKLLTKEGIEFKKVEIITDIFEDNSIHITKAKVWLVYDHYFEEAKTKVFNETGITLVGG